MFPVKVWDDGLDFMWDPAGGNWWDDPTHRRGPHYGPGGGSGGSTGINRGPVSLITIHDTKLY